VLRRILCDERGDVNWLVLGAISAALAALVVSMLLPSVREVHDTIVDRITGLSGSGF
jgi:hypothetical protein